MSPTRLPRRQVLVGGAAAAAAAVAGVLVVTRVADDGSSPEVSAGGSSTTAAPLPTTPPQSPEEAIATVGAAYLAASPTDEPALRAALPELTGATPTELVSGFPALSARVQDDFAAGRTVDLDGWILSETEAQAAALVKVVS